MDGLLADDAEDVAAAPEKADALPDEDLRIPPTNRRRIHEAVVVDVLDDEADLVDVTVEHDGRRAARVDLRHAVAGDVRRYALSEARCFLAPDASGWPLEP